MSLLQYLDGNSFFHRMDPSMKFLWTMLISLLAFSVTNVYLLALLLAVHLLLVRVLANLRFRSFGNKLLLAFGPAAFFFVLYSFLYPAGRTILFSFWILNVSLEGVLFGAAVALRFPILVLTAILFVLTTDQRRFVYSLIQVLRVPVSIAYMLMVALRIAPLIEEEMNNIIDAHAIRGMDMYAKGVREKFRRYRLIIIPLIVRMFKSVGEQMAITLESRGFGAYKQMTFAEQLRPSRTDVLFLSAWILLFALVILAGFGTFGAFSNTFTPWGRA